MSVLFATNFAKVSAFARALASYVLDTSCFTKKSLKIIENITGKGRGVVPSTPPLNQPVMAAAGEVCGV